MPILSPLHSRAQETPPPSSQQAAPQVAPPASKATFEITGTAHSGKTALPGVTVTAANTLSGKKYVAATNSEGKLGLSGMTRGRYVVRIEFMGFGAFTQEVVLNPDNPTSKVDAELLLASRHQEKSNNTIAAMAAAGRGFQSLASYNTLSSFGGSNNDFLGASSLGGGHN